MQMEEDGKQNDYARFEFGSGDLCCVAISSLVQNKPR